MATDTDSYAFFVLQLNANEGKTAAYYLIMELSLNTCSEIISVFNHREGSYDFDSHEFISILRLCYPGEYFALLLQYIPKDIKDAAFKQLHLEIGKYLLSSQISLNIHKAGKHNTANYKGTNTNNEKWIKIPSHDN